VVEFPGAGERPRIDRADTDHTGSEAGAPAVYAGR
jgi:hypothetical protein